MIKHLRLIAGCYKEICSVHPIWCTPPVRFVGSMPEMDEVALKMGEVVDRDADAAVADEGTGVRSVVEMETVGEVNDDSGAAAAASGDGLEEEEVVVDGWDADSVAGGSEEAAGDEMECPAAGLIVVVAVVGFETVAAAAGDFGTFG